MDDPKATDEFVMSTIAAACDFERDRLTADSDLLEIGVDSLGITTLIAHAEATYACDFTIEQTAKLFRATTVREVIALVDAARGKSLVS
jgi:acyl carrier protein